MNNNEENKNLVAPVNQESIPSVTTVSPVTPTENKNISVAPVQVTTVQPTQSESVKQVNTTMVVEPTPQQPPVVQPVDATQQVDENKSDVPPVQPIENDPNNNLDDNKGPSTFAKIMTILLFIFLFVFVYFLGDITDFINEKKLEKQNAEIMNGRLLCSNETTTENLDVKVSATFTFENKKITGLTFITTSTGDKTKDKEELEELKKQCSLLKEEVKDYEGISVVCSLNNGINSVKQIYNYSTLDVESVRAAYSEAGGVYPQFKYKDDINSVESKMISSDYMCEKVSS